MNEMKIIDCEQGSDEWHAARAGRVTASRIADMMAKVRSGGPGASRGNYLAELVAERLTGTVAETFTSGPMQWGTEHEDSAAQLYQFLKDVELTPVGFVVHPTIEMAGCSPDRLVGSDGLIEIKCPNTKTHIDTLLGGNVQGKYIKQMQFQMACTERKWCDFVSYDPRMPAHMQVHVERFHRDTLMIQDIEKATTEFLAEVQSTVAKLSNLYPHEAAA